MKPHAAKHQAAKHRHATHRKNSRSARDSGETSGEGGRSPLWMWSIPSLLLLGALVAILWNERLPVWQQTSRQDEMLPRVLPNANRVAPTASGSPGGGMFSTPTVGGRGSARGVLPAVVVPPNPSSASDKELGSVSVPGSGVPPTPSLITVPVSRTGGRAASPLGLPALTSAEPTPLPPSQLAIALDRLNRAASANPANSTPGSTVGASRQFSAGSPINHSANDSLPSHSAPLQPSTYTTSQTAPTLRGSGYTLPPELQPGSDRPSTLPQSSPSSPQPLSTQVVEFDSLPPDTPAQSPQGYAPEPRPFSATGQGIGEGQIGTFSNPGVINNSQP